MEESRAEKECRIVAYLRGYLCKCGGQKLHIRALEARGEKEMMKDLFELGGFSGFPLEQKMLPRCHGKLKLIKLVVQET